MSYSGSTNRPRSIFVIIGGMIAWMGLVGGVLVTVPEYHRAMTMKDEPVEMTWQELVDNGLTDNTHVRLVNVALDHTNPLGFFQDMLTEFDPDAPAEDQQEAFELAAENMDIGQFADSITQPIKVYPKGQDPNDFAARIVVPQFPWAMDAAYEQIEESGSLTGRFTLTQSDGFEINLAKLMLKKVANAAEVVAQQAKVQQPSVAAQDNGAGHDNGVAQDNLVAPENGPAEPALAAAPADEGPKYVFEPVHGVRSEADASQLFWLSGLAIAFGLVICGSGGPSLSCCIFFQGPAMLSILGYPMRYGRAGKMTRIAYALVGIVLISYGYQKMIVEGQFGQVHGNVALAVIGFVAGSVGCGAVLGSITSVIAERLNISLEPNSTQKNPEPKMSFTEACSLEPTDVITRFVDRELVAAYNERIHDSMQAFAELLSSVGFGEPEPVAWQEGEQMQPALISLGCQEMVVADVDQSDGEVTARLISVLQDGLTIITLSSNTPTQKPIRMGTNGLYAVAESDDPIEMLSSHLERTVSMAEKRNTTIVQIEPMEATDVVLLGRRVLADVRSQYGEERMEVDSYRYGRFCFPAAAIQQPTTV